MCRLFLCFFLLWGLLDRAFANFYPDTLSSEAEISILIAEPSADEVFTLYGHAGLRVQDPRQHLDVTFNYGIFDFGEGFLLKFLKGQTDYLLVPMPTPYYMEEYLGRGSAVKELTLNMTAGERGKAWVYLLNNLRPENLHYRYNFFYDNCSTRPLDIYLDATGEKIEAREGASSWGSWREAINNLEAEYPWLVLSTDLLLGAQTDQMMSLKETFFLPHNLPHLAQLRRGNGSQMVLRQKSYEPYQEGEEGEDFAPWGIHPLIVACALLVLSLVVAISGRWLKPWLLGVFLLCGLLGLLIFYVACLSEHPHRFPNYNLWVLHPLHLLLLPLMSVGRWRKGAYCYHFANFVAQSAFLLIAWFLPQHFNAVVYLLSATLGVLSLRGMCLYRQG